MEDYVTDTPYTWGFYSDFGPVNLGYVARLSGLTPVDIDEPFRFLELGCGNGVSSNVYAECFPKNEFHAVDLNPEHIENGSRLAAEGEVRNITFHEASFESFLGRDVGEFDFIALHGVYSWVGPDVRDQICRILETKLRPGGFAYVSYNAMPGWAAMLPLREMMLAYTRDKKFSSIERAAHGLEYLEHLRTNEASFFANNTAAHQKLDSLKKLDRRYVAHEFFHKYWSCFYFEQVAGDMEKAGLSFAGSVPSWLNIRDLSIPTKFRDLMGTAPTRHVYEIHKSFVLNEMFRRDLYVKPAARQDEQSVDWDPVVFGPLVAPENLKMEIRFPVGNVGYTGPIYGVLARLLLERAMSFAELRSQAELAEFSSDSIVRSLHFLCAGGQFGAMRTPLRAKPSGATRWRLTSRFNHALLSNRLLEDRRVTLASPVVGGGVSVDLIAGLALLAFDRGEPDNVVSWTLSYLKDKNQTLRVSNEPVTDEAQQREVLSKNLATFQSETLPRLAEYGVVEPRS